MLEMQNAVCVDIEGDGAGYFCSVGPWYWIADHFVLLFERELCLMIIDWSFNGNTVCLNQKSRLG